MSLLADIEGKFEVPFSGVTVTERKLRDTSISLHIAMEASRDIILRQLRTSVSNPSDVDAANYLARAFGEPESTEHYFAGFYADRIKSVHPASR